jgi:hypothetical protein
VTVTDTRAKVWLTTKDLAERMRTAPGTVRYWRFAGVGPHGVKIGRRVLYDLREVERWENQHDGGEAA